MGPHVIPSLLVMIFVSPLPHRAEPYICFLRLDSMADRRPPPGRGVRRIVALASLTYYAMKHRPPITRLERVFQRITSLFPTIENLFPAGNNQGYDDDVRISIAQVHQDQCRGYHDYVLSSAQGTTCTHGAWSMTQGT
jgi:hypothetical protein